MRSSVDLADVGKFPCQLSPLQAAKIAIFKKNREKNERPQMKAKEWPQLEENFEASLNFQICRDNSD